jgi:hypothetical protein
MSDNLPDPDRVYLAKQAAEILDHETGAVELVSQLDIGRYESDDTAGTNATPFEPMFRARLLQIIEQYTDAELRRRIDSDPTVAKSLGFSPDSVPNRSTFQRARAGRFKNLETTVNTAAKQIRTVGTEVGSPIGPELTPDDTSGTSKRTEERLIRKNAREIVEQVPQLVFPAFDLPLSDDAIYGQEDLLEMETVMGVCQQAACQGGETYGDWLDSEAELDESDPFYLDGPSGETLLEVIKKLPPEAISEMVNRGLRRIFARLRPHEDFPEPVMLAIDVTYVGITVNGREIRRVTGAPDSKEFKWCFKFATANIVGDAVKLPVAMLPVGEADHLDGDAYPGKNKSHRPGNVMRNLLDIANKYVNIRCVLADREFYAADAIAALNGRRTKYVIPVPSDERIKRFEQTIDQVTAERGYALYGAVKNEASNERVITSLVGLPADESYGDEQVFATNLEVDDEIGLDRRKTKRQINRYNRRGGIETSYSKIKEFGVWTTSMAFPIRQFHFGFALLLYATWLFVDFLVKTSHPGIENRIKPRLKAGRFRSLFETRLKKLI